MLAHLKVHHPQKIIKKSAVDSKSRTSENYPTLQDLWRTHQRIDPKSNVHNEITRAIATFIAKDGLPIYAVEKPGFKQLINTILCERYSIPSRRYFSDVAIPSMYFELRSTVEAELCVVKNFSATTDLWSSFGLTPYISLTIHFINSEWVLCSRNLNTTYIPEDHTSSNIAQMLLDMLLSWNLNLNQLACFTTDNGSNIRCAISNQLGKQRVACFGHILHNAVTNSLDEDSVILAIKDCKRLVAAFNTSFKKRRDLEEVQRNLKLPLKVLVNECPTRWNSKYLMIKRLLENEQALKVLLSSKEYQRSDLLPPPGQWIILEAVHKALEPFSIMTDLLSGDKDVTISSVIPVIERIKTICKPNEEDHILSNLIREKIKNYILPHVGYSDNDRQQPTNSSCCLYSICTFLDPRYRGSYLEEPMIEVGFVYAVIIFSHGI